jgi:hypothetical protein
MSVAKEIILLPYRAAQWFPKGLLMTGLLAALALNVVSLTSTSTFDRLSGWVETVVGPRTVRTRTDAAQAKMVTEAADLTAEVDRLTNARTDLEAALAASQAETANLSKDLAGSEAVVAELTGRLAVAETVSLAGTKVPVADAVARSSVAVANRLTAIADRTSATAQARALPFAGVRVDTAVAAADLADGCAAMRDLAALGAAFGQAGPDAEAFCARPVTKAEALWSDISADPAAAWAGAAELLDTPTFQPDDAYRTILRWGTARFFADVPGN